MSLDLINVGAEANDGTGDTPRAAGIKMNAAIAFLNALPAGVDYSAAIDALETAVAALETVQGTQAGAIADIQSAVDLLESAPAVLSAIDYDQTAEPVSPSNGQVWRERTIDGLLVADWQWSSDSALWLSAQEYTVTQVTATTLSGALPNFFNPAVPLNIFVLGIHLLIKKPDTYNSSNYYNFAVNGLTESNTLVPNILGTSTFSANTSEILATPAQHPFRISFTPSSPVIGNTLSMATIYAIAIGCSPVNSPGSFNRARVMVSYRRIRG